MRDAKRTHPQNSSAHPSACFSRPSRTTGRTGADEANPAPVIWLSLSVLNTLGFVRMLGDTHAISMLDPVYALPKADRSDYLANLYKQKSFITRCEEWIDWPKSNAAAEASGDLGDLPLIVFTATGKDSVNRPDYAGLSTNSTLVTYEGASHYLTHEVSRSRINCPFLLRKLLFHDAPTPNPNISCAGRVRSSDRSLGSVSLSASAVA